MLLLESILKQEGEDCGPCFNPADNFNCGTCAEGLECKKDPESAIIPDATAKCRKKQGKIFWYIRNIWNISFIIKILMKII